MREGACVAGGVCGKGSMHGKGGRGLRGRRDGHCSGRSASYWNVFLPGDFLDVEREAVSELIKLWRSREVLNPQPTLTASTFQ